MSCSKQHEHHRSARAESRAFFLVLTVLLTACDGTATDPDGGPARGDGGLSFDAGPPPIKYDRFTKRADGWPTGARVRGAAVLDNVLFVASDQGVLQLPAIDTRWTAVTTPLTGDLKPTSLDVIDQSLVMTAAGASLGGLFVKPYDGAWAAVATAPPSPAWLLTKKSTDYLLATTGGLFKATALTGPWTRRSAANTPVFTAAIAQFAAAPSQAKLFAAGATGGLFESADVGATWTASTLRGTVNALAATGAFVLVATSMDGQQRSDNYGNTFRPAATPLTDTPALYVVQGTRFWAGGSGGLLSSDDNGVTFTANSDGLPTGTAVRALFFAGSYAIVDTADGPYINQPR